MQRCGPFVLCTELLLSLARSTQWCWLAGFYVLVMELGRGHCPRGSFHFTLAYRQDAMSASKVTKTFFRNAVGLAALWLGSRRAQLQVSFAVLFCLIRVRLHLPLAISWSTQFPKACFCQSQKQRVFGWEDQVLIHRSCRLTSRPSIQGVSHPSPSQPTPKHWSRCPSRS